jgi:hypothetical protein
MSEASTQYERFVRDIVQVLLQAQGLETVVVEHDKQVQGISRAHQIDVYWEYRLGGVLHRVVINCKRYGSTVEVTDVLTLAGVLQDMPGVRGLIVTTVGFQSGAIDYAKVHQIGLKVIRPPRDSDWEGRIRQFNLELTMHEPKLVSCRIDLDRKWVEENVTADADSLIGSAVADADTTVVRDLSSGTVENMNELWNRAMAENPSEIAADGRGVLRWADARLERPGAPSLRVNAIEFAWTIPEGRDDDVIRVAVRSDPAAIVRDAIAGTLLFVDPNGRVKVTGDIDEELGRSQK